MKPIHARPSLYAFYFEQVKSIGLEYGYNIVLHGSMNRDLDLIAIPWGESIGDKTVMLNKIAEVLGGFVMQESEEDRQKFRVKYHGRECWVININRTIKQKFDGFFSVIENFEDPQYYIDISILSHQTI